MRLKLPYSEYTVVCGDRIWFVFVYCYIRHTDKLARPYSYIIYTVYGHGTRILLYTAYGRACNTVFVYFSTVFTMYG
jgi:hypothetical protein